VRGAECSLRTRTARMRCHSATALLQFSTGGTLKSCTHGAADTPLLSCVLCQAVSCLRVGCPGVLCRMSWCVARDLRPTLLTVLLQ
jgi:hypothetical protein